MSGIIDLYDIDRPMAEQNAEIGTRLFKRSDVKGNWKFEVSGSLKELLEKKPEFVIISILPVHLIIWLRTSICQKNMEFISL